MFSRIPLKLTPEELRIFAHTGSGGYAMFWIVFTLLIFGGVYAVLDYLGADENVRTQSFVVLAAIAIWRAMRSREGEPASARSFLYGERWRI
jgi:hypothetical protein